jgi:hypothetical protein
MNRVLYSLVLYVALPLAWPAAPLLPAVEVEYLVYRTAPFNNGSGPLWCKGSTCIARLGNEVYANGVEVLTNCEPLNNVRWTLWRLDENGPTLLQADLEGRQREPSPMGVFNNGRLLLTSNPTLTKPGVRNGPAMPVLLVFDAKAPLAAPWKAHPAWEGEPPFTEHSYRGFCADGPSGEALYLQNVGYDFSHWSFLDREGRWSKAGSIKMPWGAEFETPESVRVCYQVMALKNRAAHLLGMSDVMEWKKEWREYKLILHNGVKWDYDMRRLYYCYTPDVAAKPFGEWLLVSDCDRTCGLVDPMDLWLDGQGRAHLLWYELSVWDVRVRDKFFPDEPQTHTLM